MDGITSQDFDLVCGSEFDFTEPDDHSNNSPNELKEMIDDMPSSQFQAFIMAVAQHEPSFVSHSRNKLTKELSAIYIVLLTIAVVSEVVVVTVITFTTAKEIQMTKKII